MANTFATRIDGQTWSNHHGQADAESEARQLAERFDDVVRIYDVTDGWRLVGGAIPVRAHRSVVRVRISYVASELDLACPQRPTCNFDAGPVCETCIMREGHAGDDFDDDPSPWCHCGAADAEGCRRNRCNAHTARTPTRRRLR